MARLSDAGRLERVRARANRTVSTLQRVSSEERKLTTRLLTQRKIVVGANILLAIEHDPELRRRICAIMQAAKLRPNERALLVDLLQPE